MIEKISFSEKERWPMLAWLILPLLVFWLSVSYLVGRSQEPAWVTEKVPTVETKVFSAQADESSGEFVWENTGLVTLWFDDAWLSQYTVAFPILEKYQVKAALSVATKMVGLEKYMSWAQIKRLQAEGWEIVSHTRSHHCEPGDLTKKKVKEELEGAKEDLEAQGLLVENFVTPCGSETPVVEEVAKEHYLSLRTSGPGLNPLPVTEPYRLLVRVMHPQTTLEQVSSWLQEAKEKEGWLILVYHQLDFGGEEFSALPPLLKETILKIQEMDMPVVLPRQALQIAIE